MTTFIYVFALIWSVGFVLLAGYLYGEWKRDFDRDRKASRDRYGT